MAGPDGHTELERRERRLGQVVGNGRNDDERDVESDCSQEKENDGFRLRRLDHGHSSYPEKCPGSRVDCDFSELPQRRREDGEDRRRMVYSANLCELCASAVAFCSWLESDAITR